MEIMDRKARFRKGIGSSPFESINTAANPFATLGVEWCPRCEMEVDCDTNAVHEGTFYGYKRTCNRCGKVVKAGGWNNVPILSGGSPLFANVQIEWMTEPGIDRRGRRRG